MLVNAGVGRSFGAAHTQPAMRKVKVVCQTCGEVAKENVFRPEHTDSALRDCWRSISGRPCSGQLKFIPAEEKTLG